MAQATPARKTCTKCQTSKPLDEFGLDRNRRDGFNPWCKVCNRANALRVRNENLDRVRQQQRASYQANREVAIARVRAYARRNRDKILDKHRQYYQDNREVMLAAAAEYKARNPEKVREARRKSIAKRPDYYRALSAANAATRRARLAKVVQIPFTQEQLAQRLAYYGNRCWICGNAADTLDHVKPIAKGGPNMLANLRPACKSCNSGKCDRWPFVPPQVLRKAA
ncbi:MAG: HNH endonuclease [Actinomycetota bacterium]|nr:HNH endonuclease [Actinomycetota bacterium]